METTSFEINPNLLHRWWKQFRRGPGNVFPWCGKAGWDEAKVAQLERKVGQQALEISKGKAHVPGARATPWRPAGTQDSVLRRQIFVLQMARHGW